MSRLFYFTLVLCLLISGASATTFCTGNAPSFAPGASCGNGAAGCQIGYYCDATAICVPKLAAGKKCDMSYDDECEAGTRCQGTSTNAVCVKFASLGETCQEDTAVTKPVCGGGWDCDATTNKCIGGSYGDVCKNDADCDSSNFNCTGGVCGAVSGGGFCNGTIACGPEYFCDDSISPVACSLRKTEGICNNPTQCAFGYACARYFDGDSTRQCIPTGSVGAGKFCEGHEVCQSGRCTYGSYCAAGKAQYCTSSNECAIDESCTCNGLEPVNGDFYTCTYNPCFPTWKSLLECINRECGYFPMMAIPPYGSVNFETYLPGNCFRHGCPDEFTAMVECAGASQLVVSLLFTTLVAFFAYYSSKEF